MAFWGQKVSQLAGMYPLAWIVQAAEIAATKSKGWPYVHAILRGWTNDGGPPRPESRRPAPALTASHRPRSSTTWPPRIARFDER